MFMSREINIKLCQYYFSFTVPLRNDKYKIQDCSVNSIFVVYTLKKTTFKGTVCTQEGKAWFTTEPTKPLTVELIFIY